MNLEQTPLKLSRFAHMVEREDQAAFVHALSFDTVFTDLNIAKAVEGLSRVCDIQLLLEQTPESLKETLKRTIEAMSALDLLVPANDDETERYKEFVERLTGTPSVSVLYLLLTDKCNFSCTYCYIENGLSASHQFSYMTAATAMRALDLFSEVRNPSITDPLIIFYGGEPLLNEQCLSQSISYIQQCKDEGRLPDKTRISLITNGSLVTPEIALFLKQNDVVVSVSIDGHAAEHNQTRVLHSGAGTFSKALKAYLLFQEVGLEPGISCTINHHNIGRLEEINRWFVEDLGATSIGYNLPMYAGTYSSTVDDLVEEATDELLCCFAYNREHGVYEDRMMRKVNAFVGQKVHVSDCAGCGNQIVVAPDGSTGVCQAFIGSKEYFSGNVYDGGLSSGFMSTLQEWSKRSPLNMTECLDCPALGICGGGCPYNAVLNSGSIWALDGRFCSHSKKALEWLVWDLYAQSTTHSESVEGVSRTLGC